jgi:hypothetical protein
MPDVPPSCKGRVSPEPASFLKIVALTLALVRSIAAGPATAQTLKYAGEEGDRARYRLTNTMKIHQEFQGIPTDLTVRSHSLLTLLLERSEDDTLTFGVTFDSLNVKFEGAPLRAPDLSPVLGRKMTLKVSPRGQVFSFELPADMPAAPAGFDLKQMVSHFFPRVPGGRAKPGTTWSDTLNLPVAQQGIQSSVQVVTRYTSRGKGKGQGGKYLEVGYATLTTISGKGEQGGTPLFLDGKGTGKGTILFGDGGETFWSSKGTQTLNLVVDVTPEGQPPLSIPVRQEITAEIQHL